jgi:YidC/Oxa1 family membrane protein insertase
VGPLDTILKPLYYGVSWIIAQFHVVFGAIFGSDSGLAWGLSIVMLTVLVRAAMIPLFVKQIKSMRTMQALQPKMKVIQERYKNDRQRQSEEMMKLYKEAGTNPAASCLPLLVQSPFFMSLYGVLRNVANNKAVGVITGSLLVSAANAHIFGAKISETFVGSTSTSVKVVTAIFILTMCFTQFLTTRQLMTKNVDLTVKTPYMQQQKMMMYVLPVIYIFFGITMPVGVLVYMVTSNAWTLGQQLVIIRRNPTPGSVAWKERQARLKAAGKLNTDGTEIKGSVASLVKGGTPAPEDAVPEVAPVRNQPKRQTKAKRSSGGTGGGQQSGGQPSGGTKTAPARGRATTGGNRNQSGGGQSSNKKKS